MIRDGLKMATKSKVVRERVNKNRDKTEKKSKAFRVEGYPDLEVVTLIGQVVKGMVSHLNSCKEFWIQYDKSRVEKIGTMLEEGVREKVNLVQGGGVVAQWDGAWYRGSVVEVIENQVKVHFLD